MLEGIDSSRTRLTLFVLLIHSVSERYTNTVDGATDEISIISFHSELLFLSTRSLIKL